MTGVVPGSDRPTICHSGKPKPNTCYAVSREPGREGWVLVQNPPSERHRDGWLVPGVRPSAARRHGKVWLFG